MNVMVLSGSWRQKATTDEFNLTIKTLDLCIAQFAESQLIDEIEDLLQRSFDGPPLASDHAEAQNCALPKLLIAALGHRNIELIGDPSLNRFEHASLSFQ
jgi:hypothetical protein